MLLNYLEIKADHLPYVLTMSNILLTNDAPYNYWWLIGILKDTAVVYQGEKYSETVVSE